MTSKFALLFVSMAASAALLSSTFAVAQPAWEVDFFDDFDRFDHRQKFDMIFSETYPHYMSLPGVSVLVGGMWVMNLSYWGFNQYIIQRALGAESLSAAQQGIAFAAFLKLLMPVIVVLPGIAMFALDANLAAADQAYPSAMNLLPVGVKGLVFAALLAAIVSSLASMCNSISTIFTVDVLPVLIGAERTKGQGVAIGRTAAIVAMLIAMVTAQPLLGNFDQAFQYIQEFTGFFTHGIVVIFLLGIFWPGTTATAALLAASGSALLSIAFKLVFPELPFIDRVGVVFLCCVGVAVTWSLFRPADKPSSLDLSEVEFATSSAFNGSALAVALILAGFYSTWW